jgi:heptosyltransferase-2
MGFRSDPRIAERQFQKIVVRVPNPLGDQILATPALQAIRERYPGAHITGHGSATARDLFDGADWFDDFLVADRKRSRLAQARELRARGFEACILLTGSFRTAWIAFLAGIRHRIGYRWSGRTPLLTAHWRRPRPGGKRAPYPTKQYFLDLVAKLGATGGGRVRLPLSEPAERRAAEWMREQGIGADAALAGMCVGARFGPSKVWPSEYFARVADHLVQTHGMRVVVICAPGEEETGAAVRAHARHPVIDTGLAPLRTDVLKFVIRRCRLLVTNDIGPRHIAAAFQVPIVCLMGSTSPVYTDTDTDNTIVLREPVACSPCHLEVCPIDHRCMIGLRPERAIEAADRLLA